MSQNSPVPTTLPKENTLIDVSWAGLEKLNEDVRDLGQINSDIFRKEVKKNIEALLVDIEKADLANIDAHEEMKDTERAIQLDMINLAKSDLPVAKEEYLKAAEKRQIAMAGIYKFQELFKDIDAYEDFLKSCQTVVDSYPE